MRDGLSTEAGSDLGGRYRLETPIGQGGMGEVRRATDLRLRRSVAVKVLPPSLAGDATAVARFRREARFTIANLGSPDPYFSTDFGLYISGTRSGSEVADSTSGVYPSTCPGGNINDGDW